MVAVLAAALTWPLMVATSSDHRTELWPLWYLIPGFIAGISLWYLGNKRTMKRRQEVGDNLGSLIYEGHQITLDVSKMADGIPWVVRTANYIGTNFGIHEATAFVSYEQVRPPGGSAVDVIRDKIDYLNRLAGRMGSTPIKNSRKLPSLKKRSFVKRCRRLRWSFWCLEDDGGTERRARRSDPGRRCDKAGRSRSAEGRPQGAALTAR